MTRSRQGFCALLLLAATAGAYLPALRAGYVWDDPEYLTENPTVQDPAGLRRIWLEPRANPQYYPLVFTSFWVEQRLWGLEPFGYHAVNVLLHVANALLLGLLLRGLALPGAWLAALFFALHPVHVESVAWVTERKNVLSGLFYLSAALAYLGFRGTGSAARRGAWSGYALALLLFGCALLSKSVTASLPAAVLLVLYWKTGRVRGRDLALLLPFFGAGLAAGLHTVWLEQVHVGAERVDWDLSAAERALIATRALCFYAGKLLWPHPLSFSYPRWNVDAGAVWQYAYGVAVVGGFGALWAVRARIGRGPLTAALFFAGTLLPALGFVDVYPMRFSFVADHFVYLASIGVLAPVAVGFVRVLPAWPMRMAAGIVLLVLAALTFQQSAGYRDEETLWRDTLAKNPTSWLAHNNLGRIHGLREQHARAAEHFARAVEIEPTYDVARTNLAEALIRQGRHREALPHLRAAMRVRPERLETHWFLWVVLGEIGEWDAAAAHLRRHSALAPSFRAHLEAARLLEAADRPADALAELAATEAFRPGSPVVAQNRGHLLMQLERFAEAAAAYREAVARKPGWAAAHNALGLALEQQGDRAAAEHEYAEALRLDPELGLARRNLARLRGGD